MATTMEQVDAKLLLAEQHHRTQNLFQLTNAVLNNAVQKATDEAAEAISAVQVQLAAFAMLNETLRMPAGGYDDRTCCAKYLSSVLGLLETSCLTARGITLEVEWPETLPATATTCRHIALVLTEIVFNAAKHAFPDRKGRIRVLLRAQECGLHLRVVDNGVGFAPSVHPAARKGRSFINTLAGAIGAIIEVQSSASGTIYDLVLPSV